MAAINVRVTNNVEAVQKDKPSSEDKLVTFLWEKMTATVVERGGTLTTYVTHIQIRSSLHNAPSNAASDVCKCTIIQEWYGGYTCI